jgi:hypothetical protein
VCTWRQHHNEQHVSHNSLVDIAHATMVLHKATAWSKLLGVDSDLRQRWAVVAAGLADLPVTTDNATLAHGPAGEPVPSNPPRRVWSEARYEHSSSYLAAAPFDTNYMVSELHGMYHFMSPIILIPPTFLISIPFRTQTQVSDCPLINHCYTVCTLINHCYTVCTLINHCYSIRSSTSRLYTRRGCWGCTPTPFVPHSKKRC